MFTVQPILMPQIDLRQFIPLLSSEEVNAVDSKRLSPTDKFCALADELLFKGFGQRHLTYSFYFELPATTEIEFGKFYDFHQFRRTSIANGMMIQTIITGPLDLWRAFLLWMSHDPMLNKLTPSFAKHLPGSEFKSLT